MTIEEFADLEIADAQERSEREKAGAAHKPTRMIMRRAHQLGLSPTRRTQQRYVHARARSDRLGSNWLEEHPRGAGNKGGASSSPFLRLLLFANLLVRCAISCYGALRSRVATLVPLT